MLVVYQRLGSVAARAELVALPALALAVMLATLHRNAGFAQAALPAAAALVLLLRARQPVTVAVVVAALSVGEGLVHDSPRLVAAAMVAVLAVAQLRAWPLAAAGAVVCGGAAVGGAIVAGVTVTGTSIVAVVAPVAAALAVGLWRRARAGLLAELRERAVRAERERELVAERALAEERARIARELHDAVAHHVGLLVVQAESLRATLSPTDRDRPVVESIAAAGREALIETRRLVDVLRPLDDVAGRTPPPGLDGLPGLAARAATAGLRVDVAVEGVPRPLPPAVDLSAYRILQEALTNALRHAGPVAAHVLVRYRPEALELVVRDEGETAANGGARFGRGLVGMRERAAMLGGELSAAAAPDGGFVVRALLPTG